MLRLMLSFTFLMLTAFVVSCVPVPSDLGESDTNPRISSLSPINPFLSLTPVSASQIFSVTVSDNEKMGYLVRWYLDGSQKSSGSSSYTFDPSTQTDGVYTLSATVSDSSGLVLYDAQNWIITITSVEYFTATPAANTTIEVMDGYLVGTPGKWTLASGVDADPELELAATLSPSTNWYVRFYADGVMTGAQVVATGALRTIKLSDANPAFKVDLVSSGIAETTHDIEAKVFSDVGATNQVGYTTLWNLNVVPLVISIGPSSVLPVASSTIEVLNGGAVSVAGNWTQASATVDPGVSVTHPLGSDSASGIEYKFSTNDGTTTTVIGSTISTSSGAVTLSSVDPTHSYILADPLVTENNHTLICQLYDVYTGVQIGSDIEWPLSVVPTTSTVNITSVFPANASTITVIDGIPNSTPGAWTQGIDASPGVVVDSNDGAPKVTFRHYKGGVLVAEKGPAAMVANMMTQLSDVDPAYAIALLPPGDTAESDHTMTATVEDSAGNPIGTVQTWNLYVRPKNTPPTITAVSPAVGAVTGLSENIDYDFVITAADDDSAMGSLSVTWVWDPAGDAELLDGTVSVVAGSVWEGINKPSCNGSALTATTCTINLPRYNSLGAVTPAAHVVTAKLTDVVTNGAAAEDSSTLTWNLATPDEVQTDSTFPNFVGLATAVQDPSTDTYIYASGTPGTSIAAITEGDIIGFNVAVTDPDRDNYYVKIEWREGAGPGTYTTLTNHLVTRADGSSDADNDTSYTLQVPEEWFSIGAPVVDFRVTVTDKPNGNAVVGSNSVLFDDVPLAESNPIPTFVAGTYDPLLTDTSNVVAGFPFTIDHGGTLGNPPWGDLTDLLYQWEVRIGVGGDCTVGAGWTQVTGANSASFTWTPPVGLDGYGACFRLCVGDDNFGAANGHAADCAAGITVGTWDGIGDGSGTNSVTIRDAEKQFVAAQVPNNTSGDVATFYDSANGYLYSAVANGTNIIITGRSIAGYILGGESSDVIAVTNFNGNPTSAYDISMTVVGNTLLVAYAFDDINDSIPGQTLPGARVLRYADFTVSAVVDTTYLISDINDGIGKIVVDNAGPPNWFLPIVDVFSGNEISLIYQASNDGTAAYLKKTLSGVTANGAVTNVASGINLILMIKNSSDNWDLAAFDVTDPANPVSGSSTSGGIFSLTTANIVSTELSIGQKLYATAADNSAATQFEILRYDNPLDYSLGADASEVVSNAGRDIVEYHTAPGTDATTEDDLLVFYSAGSDLFFTKVDTAAALMDTSFENESTSLATTGDTVFAATALAIDYTAGDVGAALAPNENQKNVVFLIFEEDTNTDTNMLLINTEDETVSATAAGVGFFPGFL